MQLGDSKACPGPQPTVHHDEGKELKRVAVGAQWVISSRLPFLQDSDLGETEAQLMGDEKWLKVGGEDPVGQRICCREWLLWPELGVLQVFPQPPEEPARNPKQSSNIWFPCHKDLRYRAAACSETFSTTMLPGGAGNVLHSLIPEHNLSYFQKSCFSRQVQYCL